MFIALGSSLRAEAPRAETKLSCLRTELTLKTDVGGVNDQVRQEGNGVALTVQNGPKTMFFEDYSLLV